MLLLLLDEDKRVATELTLNIFKAIVVSKLNMKNGWTVLYDIDLFTRLYVENLRNEQTELHSTSLLDSNAGKLFAQLFKTLLESFWRDLEFFRGTPGVPGRIVRCDTRHWVCWLTYLRLSTVEGPKAAKPPHKLHSFRLIYVRLRLRSGDASS